MRKAEDPETKIANIPPFGLRLQPDLKRKVEEAARKANRSLNAEITARLEASFALGIITYDNGFDMPVERNDLEDRIERLEARLLKLENRN